MINRLRSGTYTIITLVINMKIHFINISAYLIDLSLFFLFEKSDGRLKMRHYEGIVKQMHSWL